MPDNYKLEFDPSTGDIEIRSDADGPVCDFCADQPVTYSFGALNFPMSGSPIEHWSREDWAACQTCADLVLAGHREAVVERSVVTFIDKHPEFAKLRNDLTTAMEQTQKRFWLARVTERDHAVEDPKAEEQAQRERRKPTNPMDNSEKGQK